MEDLLGTNIAEKAYFDRLISTPLSTVIRAITKFVDDTKLTGEVAEIHGNNVTLRPNYEIVDKDTRHNIEMFWQLHTAKGG